MESAWGRGRRTLSPTLSPTVTITREQGTKEWPRDKKINRSHTSVITKIKEHLSLPFPAVTSCSYIIIMIFLILWVTAGQTHIIFFPHVSTVHLLQSLMLQILSCNHRTQLTSTLLSVVNGALLEAFVVDRFFFHCDWTGYLESSVGILASRFATWDGVFVAPE